MCPHGHGQDLPAGKLMEAIVDTFGNFEEFKTEFSQTAAKLFGSGYVWLCENRDGELSIVTTHNQVRRYVEVCKWTYMNAHH